MSATQQGAWVTLPDKTDRIRRSMDGELVEMFNGVLGFIQLSQPQAESRQLMELILDEYFADHPEGDFVLPAPNQYLNFELREDLRARIDEAVSRKEREDSRASDTAFIEHAMRTYFQRSVKLMLAFRKHVSELEEARHVCDEGENGEGKGDTARAEPARPPEREEARHPGEQENARALTDAAPGEVKEAS